MQNTFFKQTIRAMLVSLTLCLSATGVKAGYVAEVSAADAPPNMANLFTELRAGEKTLTVPGATWLQLHFSEVQLGSNGELAITDAIGQEQRLNQATMTDWGNKTAMFHGDTLHVRLKPAGQAGNPVWVRIKAITLGLPSEVSNGDASALPQALQNSLGPDVQRFVVVPKTLTPPRPPVSQTVCGKDERIAGTHPWAVRLTHKGNGFCSGSLVGKSKLLTAAHCVWDSENKELYAFFKEAIIEFNVPLSKTGGATNPSAVKDQYPVDTSKRVYLDKMYRRFSNSSYDYSAFYVKANSEDKLPYLNQYGYHRAVFALPPIDSSMSIFHFGSNGNTPTLNKGPQASSGVFKGLFSDMFETVVSYTNDTEPGSSGAGLIDDYGALFGIHASGTCDDNTGFNGGTWFQVPEFQDIIKAEQMPVVIGKAAKSDGTVVSGNKDGLFIKPKSDGSYANICAPQGVTEKCGDLFGKFTGPNNSELKITIHENGLSPISNLDMIRFNQSGKACTNTEPANCRKIFYIQNTQIQLSNTTSTTYFPLCSLFDNANNPEVDAVGPIYSFEYDGKGKICQPGTTNCRKYIGKCWFNPAAQVKP